VTSDAACGKAHRNGPAPLWRRLAALSYDVLLLAAVLVVIAAVVVAARGQRAVEPGTWWWQLGLGAVCWLFFAGFWAHGGQTLGMRAWRIRLEREDGGPVTLRLATVRFAAAWLSLLPAGLGFWWGWIDRERQCWHDHLSRTRVVRVRGRTASARALQRDEGNHE
jgi:uncharacterized RDD family membrane protein YckC